MCDDINCVPLRKSNIDVVHIFPRLHITETLCRGVSVGVWKGAGMCACMMGVVCVGVCVWVSVVCGVCRCVWVCTDCVRVCVARGKVHIYKRCRAGSCIFVCIYLYIYICLYILVHVYIYIYIYMKTTCSVYACMTIYFFIYI
jgi:hypothetical protein